MAKRAESGARLLRLIASCFWAYELCFALLVALASGCFFAAGADCASPTLAFADEPAETAGSQSDVRENAEAPAAPAAEAGADAASTGSSTTESSSSTSDASDADYSKMSLDDLKQVVQDITAEQDGLQAQIDALDGRIAEARASIAAAQEDLAEAQALAERSVRARYKVQRNYGSLVEILLDSQDLDSFIAGVEYIEEASEASVVQVTELRQEIVEYEREIEQCEAQKAEIGERMAEVSERLEAAVKARDEAQRKADLVANAHLKPDGADWKAGKKAFVKEWTRRIDRFLAGTPMAGQGEAFANAAWKNHIDPRFSPAISTVESGNGRACIRPYNAWGWGAAEPNPYALAAEWSSWEEAINAHVSGLASGYGYTVSTKGAQAYCPPNWEEWYATVVSEMNRI